MFTFTRFLNSRNRKDAHHKKNLAFRQVISATKPKTFPTWKQWEQLPTVMSLGEKKIFAGAIGAITISLFVLGAAYITAHRIEIPATGGENTEALVGTPHLINPLYASANDVDADIASLIYSGLMKWTPENGYVNDLAESITTNEEKTEYTVTLKPNAKFSNGEPVQARDVVFTYSAAQDPSYRSTVAETYRAIRIEQVDDTTILFTLQTADPQFGKKLTLGILSENLWSEILPQNVPLASLNLQPIGSGPYVFAQFTKDKKGSIKSYSLNRNTRYYGNEPKIETLTFKFYPDEISAIQAWNNKNVEGLSVVGFNHQEAIEANKSASIIYASIPRIVALFFNTENETLKSASIRKAIAQAINTETIRTNVLNNHATAIHGPLFSQTPGFDETEKGIEFDPAAATETLDKAGYEKQQNATFRSLPASNKTDSAEEETPHMTLTLTTVAGNEMEQVAEEIKKGLELLGIEITIQTISPDRLFSDIVATQDYELLLAPQYGATDPDPFYFWHSSQSGKGGLNIAHYDNASADKALETARTAKTEEAQAAAYRQFQTILLKDVPAVFLYQSTYAFVEPKKLHMNAPTQLRIPSDRFANVEDWYMKTKQVLQ